MITLILILHTMISSASNKGNVEIVSLEQLQARTVNQKNDTLYIVNFWATWCKPCVAELPYFIDAEKRFSGQKVKVIFVSLNYARELAKVENFVKQRKMSSPCYLLNAGNPNDWIDKIEKNWYGSIPVTIMYRNGEKVFFREGEFLPGKEPEGQTELNSIIQSRLR